MSSTLVTKERSRGRSMLEIFKIIAELSDISKCLVSKFSSVSRLKWDSIPVYTVSVLPGWLHTVPEQTFKG